MRMDDEERTAALIRCNRMLLARAAQARAAAREARATAEQALRRATRSRAERERRNAIATARLGSPDHAREV